MEVKHLSLLHETELFKENSILTKQSLAARITDYGILTGGFVSNDFHVNRYRLKDRAGCYYIEGHDELVKTYISETGEKQKKYQNDSKIGIRPVISYGDSCFPNMILQDGKNPFGYYGEYPMWAPNLDLQLKLETIYQQDGLELTGKKYSFQGKEKVLEYQYNDKKYVRVNANPYKGAASLSNKTRVFQDNPVWIEVKPITFYLDLCNHLAISKNILQAGLPYQTEDFDIKDYLANIMTQEIKPYQKEKK